MPCSDGTSWELKTTTTSTSYHCSSSNIHPGVNRYIVKAINSSGSIISLPATRASVSLSTPSSFTVQKLSGGYLKFTWSAVSKATGYHIMMSDTPSGSYSGEYAMFEQVDDGTTTTKTVYYPGTPGTTMYFKIRAYYYCADDAIYILSNLSTYKSVTF